MKRAFSILIITLLCLCSVAYAGHDVYITFKELPPKAQQFIQSHFPNCKIALAKMEKELTSRSYDIIFTNGDKLEFSSRGEWTEIRCRNGAIPAPIIPQQITAYVNSNYPNCYIVEIERKRSYYEIQLSNKVEIKFDKKFNIIDIDF